MSYDGGKKLKQELRSINVEIYDYQRKWMLENDLRMGKFIRYLLEKEMVKGNYDRVGIRKRNPKRGNNGK